MNKIQLITYIQKAFNVEPEYPWSQWTSYAVFRHKDTHKWFALVMDVPDEKLGLEGDEIVDVVNLKLDPGLIDELVHAKKGFLPAYHMNKKFWVSIVLDGTVSSEDIMPLLDASYDNTK